MSFKKFSYNEHAKTIDPEDFWGQVKRTINGKPFSDEQIALIVSAIRAGLELEGHDVILDIGCGNGALSDRIFADCQGGHGVDVSEYLIDVARTYFGGRAGARYTVANAVDFVTSTDETNRFTKVLCYGASMYFSNDDVRTILINLRQRFPRIVCCFLGNLPDKARMHEFYYDGEYVPGIEKSHETAMGIWRSEDEIADLAEHAGWTAAIHRMPRDFNASVYRYDVVLTPTSRNQP